MPESPPSAPSSRSGSAQTPKPKRVQRSKPQALLQFLGQLGGILLALVPATVRGLLRALQTIWRGWLATLPRLRAILPVQLRQLSDWVLTAMAIVLLIGLIGLPLSLSRATASVPQAAPQTQPVVNAPQAPAQTRATRATQTRRPLAAMRKSLIRLTAAYPGDWTEAVQLSAVNHQLRVQVDSVWNGLNLQQQKALTSDWLRQAQKRSFTGLEITDPDGALLARSPVVGSEIILFRREPG